MAEIPTIRWGIIATGMISSWFVADLVVHRQDAKVKHVVQAIGSSNRDKGQAFEAQHCPQSSPTIYGSYQEVYTDPNVDIVYIGTPHSFHKRNCLDAIAAGKPILCEKAFTLNSRDARQVFEAAKAKGVYVAEAMWLRHRPLVQDLFREIHVNKVIGDVVRMHSDFGLEQDIPNLPESSRYRQPSLGAGSLLDLGIYSLTWILLAFDQSPHHVSGPLIINATQTHSHGVEVTSTAVLKRPSTGQQGVATSTTMVSSNPDLCARFEGTKGTIEVQGECPSDPRSFTVYTKFSRDMESQTITRKEIKKRDYPEVGRGYYYEADNTALDVLAGKLQSSIMPWAETIRVLEIMDGIRQQGGTTYECDSD